MPSEPDFFAMYYWPCRWNLQGFHATWITGDAIRTWEGNFTLEFRDLMPRIPGDAVRTCEGNFTLADLLADLLCTD
jgi:hypothetical protein